MTRATILTWSVFFAGMGCSSEPIPAPSTAAPQPAKEIIDWKDVIGPVIEGTTHRIQFDFYAPTPQEFAELKSGCDELTWLEIDNSQLPPELLREVIQSLPQLQRLKLMGPVNDEGFQAIAELPELQILNLPGAEFSNEALTALENHPALQLLRFHSREVNDAGLVVLPTIGTLRFLHLIHVPITDAGLESVANCKALESFYLDGGQCTDDGLSRLIKRRPKLHFHWNESHLEIDPQGKNHEH